MPLSPQQQSEVTHQLDIRRGELMELIITRSKLLVEDLSDGAAVNKPEHAQPADAVFTDCVTVTELLQREKAELERINEAFNRIEAGQFGTCELCGGAIAFARLKVIPFARCCIACQQSMETSALPGALVAKLPLH